MTAAHRILIVDAHPDPDPARFVHALADAYQAGAAEGAREVRRIDLARLSFELVSSRAAWEGDAPPPPIAAAQADIAWAEHILFFYPLWLGDMPALLKGFLEQVARPGFAMGTGPSPKPMLKGKSARIVVTMGMPALFYRFFYRAHSLKSFERNILKFVGIKPVTHSIVGNVEGDEAHRLRWLERMHVLGRDESTD
ncbi:dehydrogenase [Nostoc sp. 3335mG]|nr:dehydrogenase [Nostoc sp. 3335mG]